MILSDSNSLKIFDANALENISQKEGTRLELQKKWFSRTTEI